MRKPILFYDLETSPIVGWAWQIWDADIFHVVHDVQIISVAWSWEGEDEIYALSLPDFKGYKPGINNINDYKLVKAFSEILSKAEVVCAQNGKNFDFKLLRTRLLIHGLDPHHDIKETDTKQWAKSKFRFTSNSQDHLARQLGVSRKIETDKNLHYKCIELGDKKYWKAMVDYNKGDVKGLKEIAHKLAPFIPNHVEPSFVFENRDGMICRNLLCLSKSLVRRKKALRKNGGYKIEYKCNDCGLFTTGPLIRP